MSDSTIIPICDTLHLSLKYQCNSVDRFERYKLWYSLSSHGISSLYVIIKLRIDIQKYKKVKGQLGR